MTALRRVTVATLAAGLMLVPILWMVATSLKPPAEYATAAARLWPSAVTLEHYRFLLADGAAVRFLNSLIVTAGTTALALAVALPAAYALVRLPFPRRLDVAFLGLVLAVKLLPPIAVAIPLFQVLRGLGLLDTLAGLVLAYQVYALPFAIWLLLGYLRDVPVEVEEAAMIDGAGLVRRLATVVVPMILPGLAATTVFVAVLAWNEFLFALLYIQSPDRFTLPTYIATMITEDETLWGPLMALGVLASLPVVLLTGLIARWLTRGFLAGTH
jgi:multiple sugar transport system permease protein